MAGRDVNVSDAMMLPSPITVHGVVVGGVSPMKASQAKSSVTILMVPSWTAKSFANSIY